MSHISVKILFIFCVYAFFSSALADSAQERRVTISASLFPRIVAVDTQLMEKLDAEDNVRLGVVYTKNKSLAKKISKLITRKVKKISGKTIVVDLIQENRASSMYGVSGVLIVEPILNTTFSMLLEHARKKNIILFSPFEGDVERGFTAGIFVGAKIRPYFNLNTLSSTKVKLNPAILKVAKTYE